MVKSKKNIPFLTGLRGLAAYTVLAAHSLDSSFFYRGTPILHDYASRLAYFGMSLFFVLSGFVIYINYFNLFDRGFSFKAAYVFFIARFARLYPLYAFSIFISLSYIPTPFFKDRLPQFIAYLTLTQSWFNLQMTIFPPDWSISTECFFYFTFILIILFFNIAAKFNLNLSKININLGHYALVSCAIFIILTYILFYHQNQLVYFVDSNLNFGANVSSSGLGYIIYYAPYVRVFEFIVGLIAAHLYEKKYRTNYTKIDFLFYLISILWIVLIIFKGDKFLIGPPSILISNFAYAPAIGYFIFYSVFKENYLTSFFSTKLMVFLGEISYSVYVWQMFMITLFMPSFSSADESFLSYLNSSIKFLIIITVTTIISKGSYDLLETPSRLWLRKLAPKE